MYTLKEIRAYQLQESYRLFTLGNQIHPKLLRRLSFFDLFDDSFDAEMYEKLYNQSLRKEVNDYHKKVNDMVNSHMQDFLEGWVDIHPDNNFAYNAVTGEQVTQVPYMPYDNCENLVMNVEVQDYWELVQEMLNDHTVKPFWTYSYYLFGNGVRAYMDNYYSSAPNYILKNRTKFNSPSSTYELVVKLSKDVESIPYKMNLPILNNEVANTIRNEEFTKMVKHHRVLKAFLETHGEDAPKALYKSIEEDGKITVKRYRDL